MSEKKNKLCELCSQACKQLATVLIIACPEFKDPRKDAGRFLKMAMNKPPGTVMTIGEGVKLE